MKGEREKNFENFPTVTAKTFPKLKPFWNAAVFFYAATYSFYFTPCIKILPNRKPIIVIPSERRKEEGMGEEKSQLPR